MTKLTPDQITALKEAAEKYNAANAELAKSHLEGTHTPEKTKAMIKAFDGFHDACDSEVIAALIAEREALREALKPFADEADKWQDDPDDPSIPDHLRPHIKHPNDDECDDAMFSVGDLRRARKAHGE